MSAFCVVGILLSPSMDNTKTNERLLRRRHSLLSLNASHYDDEQPESSPIPYIVVGSLLFSFSPFPLLSTRRKREYEDEDGLVHNDEKLNRFLFHPSWSATSSPFPLLSIRRKEKMKKEMDEAVPIDEQLNCVLFHP